MSRYTATFWSEDPDRGVLVDERMNRFAFFASPERAKRAADRLSDEDDPPLFWRRTSNGDPVTWEEQ